MYLRSAGQFRQGHHRWCAFRSRLRRRWSRRQLEEVAATDAMVNMDTLGLTLPEVWASHSDKQLTGALIFIAKKLNVPVTGVNVDQIGSTDSVQFSERKIPSITIHSLTQENVECPYPSHLQGQAF